MSSEQPASTSAVVEVPLAKYQRSVSPDKMKQHPLWQQLALGGTSCALATCATHPIDTIKLRLQLQANMLQGNAAVQYKGMFSGIVKIAREEGPTRLWGGLSPALLRAATYSATRLGLYEPIRSTLTTRLGLEEPTFGVKVSSAVASGAIGAFVGNPFELLKVRMQGNDYKYSHAFDGLVRVTREEGATTLWNGTTPACIRAALLTSSQLATYDHSKTLLKRYTGLEEGLTAHFAAAMTAGVVTTTVSTPADLVKSLVMNSSARVSPVEIARRVMQTEGARGFLRGWSANYARLGPHTLLTVLVYENLRRGLGWDNL